MSVLVEQYEKQEIEVMVEAEDVPGSAVNRHIAYDVMMTSKIPLKIDEDYNKRPLTCNASITGLKTVELTIMPVMLCKYRKRTGRETGGCQISVLKFKKGDHIL